MTVFLTIMGVILAMTTRYFNLATMLLYGAVGYVLGSVIELKRRARDDRREMDDLRSQVRNFILDRLDSKPVQKAPSAPTAPTPKPEAPRVEAPKPQVTKAPVETPREPAMRPPPKPSVEKDDFDIAALKIPKAPGFEKKIIAFFTTGNVFGKVGALLLFFGIAFLIKLVSDQGLLPIEFRLMGAGVTAFVLIGIGWKLRFKDAYYGTILQGTGFGVFYLTVFGAFRIWNLLPPTMAFVMVVAATVLFCLLSVLQNSKILAALALFGGYSAPVLISTGSGNHIALFSYYSLLNLGVLFMAKQRPWRELNLIGFFFTYGVGTMWGLKYYTPDHFSTVEPFLIFFFLLFLSVALLFGKLQAKFNKDFIVDATLVFGVPIATFALQARLVRDFEYGIAISAAVMGLFFVTLATILFKKGRKDIQLMVESFLASGICFTILAVPFAFNNAWTSAVWAFQGAFLVWVSLRQNRPMGRYFGMALQFLASAAFFTHAFPNEPLSAVNNAWFLGSLVIFASCFFVGRQLFKRQDKISSFEKSLVGFFVAGAVFWWVFGAWNEVPRVMAVFMGDLGDTSSYHPLRRSILNVQLAVVGTSLLGFFILAQVLAWSVLRYTVYVLPLLLLLSAQSYSGGFLQHDVDPALFGTHYFSHLMLAFSALFITCSLVRSAGKLQTWEKNTHFAFLIVGYFWWYLAHYTFFFKIAQRMTAETGHGLIPMRATLMVLFVASSALLFRVIAGIFKSPPLNFFRYSLTAFGFYFFVGTVLWHQNTLLSSWSLVAWPSLIIVFYVLLWDGEKHLSAKFSRYQHFSGFWLLSVIVMREAVLFVQNQLDAYNAWPWCWLLGVIGAIVLVVLLYPDTLWPFGPHRKSYLKGGIAPHVLALLLGSQALNLFSAGNAAPLPYIPFLNPLGIAVLFCLLVLSLTYFKLEKVGAISARARPTFLIFLGVMAVAWLSMGLIRTVHHYNAVPWYFEAILASSRVQSGLSILWGVLGLGIMVVAHRKSWRGLWIAGCVLMVLVVIKLFLFDLNDRGTLERVISFIGAGVLLLLTGYFAPIPSTQKKAE